MDIKYRSVMVKGKRYVECPDAFTRSLTSASAANPNIPAPLPVNHSVFQKRRDPTKIYYSSADIKRLAKGEEC